MNKNKSNNNVLNIRIFLFLLTLLLLISGAATVYAEKIELNYRLKWLFNTSVAGDIYADAKGFFDDAGLNVNVKQGSPEKNAINEIELGRAQFGVASADQVIRALDKKAKIVVIAQLLQINPMQWIYRADKPKIKVLNDLKGRNIGITFGGNDETIMNTVFAKAGISKNDVNITGVRFDFTPFLMKKVDIWPVYRNTQGVILKEKLAKQNEHVFFFNPADFGINFVANSVITSREMIKNKPDIVKKFLTSLLKGWEAAMDPANEKVTLDIIKKLDKADNDKIRKKQLTATRKLIKPFASVKIGTININAWKQTQNIMLKEKQIKNKVNIENHLIQVNY